jgi:hypothetical protein
MKHPLSLTCPECGRTFVQGHHLQAFCEPDHKRAFHDRNAIRGKVILPLILTMRAGKRGRTDDTAYALQQVSVLADKWRAEDKSAGRRPDVTVTRKRAMGWSAHDVG